MHIYTHTYLYVYGFGYIGIQVLGRMIVPTQKNNCGTMVPPPKPTSYIHICKYMCTQACTRQKVLAPSVKDLDACLYTYIRMYVCMYVCMYVRTYVRMYVYSSGLSAYG